MIVENYEKVFTNDEVNIIKNEQMKKMIISKEDFRNYFNEKRSIKLIEYEGYLNKKRF